MSGAPIIAPSAALGGGKAVVLFAGGGGACMGIAEALGRDPDAALNHWPTAVAVHALNFPGAEHHCADVHEADPRSICPGEPIDLLWLSPDCRHFSKAKGGTPVSGRVRGLAWSALPWAKLRRPAVIILENVEEFLTWGPLLPCGTRPDPARAGETFARWKRRLETAGHVVEHRVLSAADYGAPTIRKRLFVVARCDGLPVVWPAPTHAPRAEARRRRLPPHRAAAEIIDWSRPCPSIFLSPEEAKAAGVRRPLQEATLRRIARGLERYTIAAAEPFIVPVTHSGDLRAHDVNDPLRVITTAKGGAGVVGHPAGEPVSTVMNVGVRQRLVTAELEHAGVCLVPRYSEREGQAPRCHDLREPTPTIVGTNNQGALVSASLVQLRGAGVAREAAEPVATLTAGGKHQALLTALLGRDLPLTPPFGPRGEALRAFLIKYYGAATAADLADPLGTVTSRARFGLVVVRGEAYRIVDIGLRMLDPETELAAAMGVPRRYTLGHDVSGRRLSKATITRLVGNMVCPPVAEALVRANLGAAEPVRAAA